MNLPTGRSSLFAVVLLASAFLAAVPPAAAQEGVEEFEEVRTDSIWVVNLAGDSVWADSLAADSIRAVVIEDSLASVPTVQIADVQEGFHPTYQVRASRIRQTTSVNQEVTFDYLLRENLVFKSQSTWEKKKSERGNRGTSIRKFHTELQHLVRDGLRIGLKYDRETNVEDEQLRDTDIVRNRLLLEATFIRDLVRNLRLTVNLQGGIDYRDKDSESRSQEGAEPTLRFEDRRGSSRIGSVGLKYTPTNHLELEVTGSGTRTGVSIVTTDGVQELSRQDTDGDATDRLKARVRFDRFSRANLEIRSSLEKETRNFAVGQGLETTTENRRNYEIDLSGDLTRKTTYKAKFDYRWGNRLFRSDPSKSQERLQYGADVTLQRPLPFGVASRVVMRRSVQEDTYFPGPGDPDQTGKTDRGGVTLNLTRKLWADTKLRLTGDMAMLSRVYVDSVQDKDKLDQGISASLDYTPDGKFSGSALFDLTEERSVNIHSTRSANNETKQTWRLSPTVQYQPRPGLKIRSLYAMTLIYIFKDVDSRRNTMTRISELRSSIDWEMTARALMQLEYRYKLDESGAFESEGSILRTFLKDQEGSIQKLNLKISYQFHPDLAVESGQFLQVDKRYDLSDGRELDSHQNKAQIYNQVVYRRRFSQTTRLNVKAKQIQDTTIPIFSSGGALRGGKHSTQWEISGSLSFQL